MNDFITLTCPNCGGKLDFLANATSLVCPNCGNEHIIRHQGDAFQIEASGKCPKCNRNDRVEKVTAILSGQTHTVTGTRPVTDVHTDSEGRVRSSTSYESYSTSQTSVLAQRLAPPQKPSAGASCSAMALLYLAFIYGPSLLCGGVVAVFAALSAASSGRSGESFLGVICAIPLFIGGVLLILAAWKSYQNKMTAQKKRRVQLETVDLPQWERAMERWSKLYYCHRDDVVFIPGDGKSSSATQTREYIYET